MPNVNYKHGPPEREGPDSPRGTGTDSNYQVGACTAQHSNSSRQVSWWTVHEFVQHVLAEAGSWPMVGTPAWCLLDDNDPVKIAAVYDAAQHHALRLELNQEALAEASHDVSQAADWSQVATETVQRESFYAARPYLKRVAS